MNYIEIKDRNKLSTLFEGIDEKIVDCCLQGRNGSVAFADSVDTPKCAKLTVGGKTSGSGAFSIIAGDADADCAAELILGWREGFEGSELLVGQNEKWNSLIEQTYGENAVKLTRYALSKTEHNFDIGKLEQMSRSIPNGYVIKLMDGADYDLCAQNDWSYDNIANFSSREEFCREGVGVCCLYKGELVCAATPYCLFDDGIEIEIDTHPEHRRKGLARACAAKLIIECINKNLYPSWDAANKASLSLAVSLGYVPAQPYTAYYIAQPGKRPTRSKVIAANFENEEISAKMTLGEGRGLCVLFPGMGYTCDRPLLHFTQKIALSKGYDVLALSYGKIPTTLREARCERVTQEVCAKCRTLLEAAGASRYDNIIFAAKSLGTLAAGALGQGVRQIWYTPVEESFANFDSDKCIVFTGDADPLLGLDRLRELGCLGSDKVTVIERAGHSLDVADPLASLEILRCVTERVQKFFDE
ncbi:MAG: GNAT family N-acetyltransferase [Clostridia bacterium]|nr:GNAT family N-acetyltransferase [Clostridia bacterium]